MKYLVIFLLILIPSCRKKSANPTTEITKPILIRVEAEHLDGDIIYSPIMLVR